ncbi:WD40-repeat-containing domain protein [Russula aff. rugulosa BPL654]|nr:WD40-repeat-containing domain protein [Russula aff. rugulosa BPL654]
MEDNEKLPWYRDRQTEPPFRLSTYFKSLRHGPEYCFVSLFPWSLASVHDDHFGDDWARFIETYAGSIVVGSTQELYLIRALRPSDKQKKQIRLDVELHPITAVAWALGQSRPFDPLIVIAISSMLCVYSVGRGVAIGFMRGHGGPISSIAVHPRVPSYICTTSSDQTARIYDLDRLSDIIEENPFWLPGTGPSKAGAPHGLRSSEREEWGKGLCTTILQGGRSGGHLAAVTCAAFHSTFPLIATGGMDRVVKIWRIHDYEDRLLREDKPLYSSTLVHRSSVASVVWLSQDTLVTHCTSTPYSSHIDLPREQHHIQDEDALPEKEWRGSPGRIVILRWLGLNRFFPPEETKYRSIQRGCLSDFQESSSFTVIASIPLPYHPDTPHLRVFGDVYHDHIILIAHQRTIRLLNTLHVPGVETTEFPAYQDLFPTEFAVESRLQAEGKVDAKCLENNDWVRGLGWCINLAPSPKYAADEHVNAVDMGPNGEMIVAVGSKGSMWIWMKDLYM